VLQWGCCYQLAGKTLLVSFVLGCCHVLVDFWTFEVLSGGSCIVIGRGGGTWGSPSCNELVDTGGARGFSKIW